jgi:hypothetical protein
MKIPTMVRQAAALVLGVTYLFGCLPVPWFYHTRPNIDGVVTRNGVPVDGAQVGYSNDLKDVECDSPNDSYSERTVSSTDGKFHFKGTHSFFHIVFLLPAAAEFESGRICFDTSDGQSFRKEVFLNGGTIFGSIPNNQSSDLLTINCELASDTCRGTAR